MRSPSPIAASAVFMMATALVASGCAAPTPDADLIVRNARLVTEHGTVVSEATLVVNGGRIARVARGPLALRGREEVDAAGRTVIPGLIDSHARVLPGDEVQGPGEPASTELRAFLEESLRRGVTTVVSVGDDAREIVRLRERILRGDLLGPRIYAVGPVLTPAGGAGTPGQCEESPLCRGGLTREVEGPEKAREAVRILASLEMDGIAVAPGLQGDGPESGADLLEAVLEEARGLDLPVLAYGPAGAAEAAGLVARGIDVLMGAPELCETGLDRLAGLLRERSIPVVFSPGSPPPTTGLPGSGPAGEEGLPRSRSCLHALHRLEVTLLLGTGAPGPEEDGGLLSRMGQLHSGGWRAREVVDSATVEAGRSMAILSEVGLIEPGRFADLVLLERNPRDDLGAFATIKVVILGGRVVVDKRPR